MDIFKNEHYIIRFCGELVLDSSTARKIIPGRAIHDFSFLMATLHQFAAVCASGIKFSESSHDTKALMQRHSFMEALNG